MALLLSLAYATVRATLDDTLVDPEDIEALGVAPVLGVVPKIALPSRKELLHARV
jgi:capsular polysaccharide biosynthesis protein